MNNKNLILIELNEINFDFVRKYIDSGEKLHNLNKIISDNLIITESEAEYSNLEPWIQWPSVHTGMPFKDHKVFRLGDFINSNEVQIFEKIENAGFKVGAISPMNASNRLSDPKYFIPDPWTDTKPDNSFLSRSLASSISQAVNDNSEEKLTFKTLLKLLIAFVMLVSPFKYFSMVKLAIISYRKSWRKALFLDAFLHNVHMTLLKRKSPNFSVLFLNAGAHIQHHYFYNSRFINDESLKNPSWYIDEDTDPFLEMLKVYDKIIGDTLKLEQYEVIIATGLSQKPYEELKFYYRLKDHAKFLNDLNISFSNVHPRMTRDFLVSFANNSDALDAEKELDSLTDINGIKLFNEIDNRGKELFVVLTYPYEIKSNTFIKVNNKQVLLLDYVTFVAIKNGEHQSKGFAFYSKGILQNAPLSGTGVHEIHNSILNYFGIPNK